MLSYTELILNVSELVFVFLKTQAAGEVDLPSYGHQQVDRFAVLLDLWSNEAAFLENKRQVSVYLQMSTNPKELCIQPQTISTIMNQVSMGVLYWWFRWLCQLTKNHLYNVASNWRF